MTPREKLLALCEFDWRKEADQYTWLGRHISEDQREVYQDAFERCLKLNKPLLHALIDENEMLRAALEKIKTFPMESVDKNYLLIQIEGFKKCSQQALSQSPLDELLEGEK